MVKSKALQAVERSYAGLLTGVVELLQQARRTSARSVNAIMTATYWEIGRRIVEHVQQGKRRAGYGEALIERLAFDLTAKFGRGFSRSNLWQMRDFYMAWPILQAVPAQLGSSSSQGEQQKLQTLSGEFGMYPTQGNVQTVSGKSGPHEINAFPRFPLPWSHYVCLLSVKDVQARTFYEAEALRGGWSVRQLDRQISTLFYERTALSRNKATMLRKGQRERAEDRVTPEEEIKDPLVLEFLGLKDEYSETKLEEALILHLEIRTTCHQQGLPAPNYRTVRRRLASIDPQTTVGKRHGSKAAQELFRPVQASHFVSLLPLEVVEVGHTRVDVMVVDERERLPISRPWLSLAIDVASRAVTGFYVSLDAPSVVSVAMVLAQAVLPKETWLADRNLDVAWPVAGIPDLLYVDNGPDFDSDALARGCEEYGIELKQRPVRQPRYGGHIERLIGTMMGAIHMLPGTTFSNVEEKADYPSEKTACLTLGDLERWLTLEIAGVYHQSVHSALLKPPVQVWKEGLARRARPPRQPVDREEFFLDFLPAEKRFVRRDGIRLFNIHYWHSCLSPLCGRGTSPMMVKYDPRNLSRVFLQTEDGGHWPIPYRDLRFPPISLWEHGKR